MESSQSISKIEIPINKITYDKKTKIFSCDILEFTFIGHYKKSIRIKHVLDDIHASLGDLQVERKKIFLLSSITMKPISEMLRLKDLKKIIEKEKIETERRIREAAMRSMRVSMQRTTSEIEEFSEILETDVEGYFGDDVDADLEQLEKEILLDQTKIPDEDLHYISDFEDGEGSFEPQSREKLQSEIEKLRKVLEEPKKKARDMGGESSEEGSTKESVSEKREKAQEIPRSVLPGGANPQMVSDASRKPDVPAKSSDKTVARRIAPSKDELKDLKKSTEKESHLNKYNINMGLQYYSVMMEQKSYLFYVFFSHKELKIADEEGKVIYETTFTIETTKEEPPILELRVKGEGFQVHPLSGRVEVEKDIINPPVMIFSILPVKLRKKKKKEIERRTLNVFIEFENKIINHTKLCIIVQPKHFHLSIGPIDLNIGKKTAMFISFLSIVFAIVSVIYSVFALDPLTSSPLDILTGYFPGLASMIFVITFTITLFKEGIYPLKQKVSSFLNFDKTSPLIK